MLCTSRLTSYTASTVSVTDQRVLHSVWLNLHQCCLALSSLIHVVQGWSEGSLTMTENYLQRHFNVGIPKWMRPSTWPQINFVVDTFNDYEEAPQGITIQPVTAQNMTALTTPADTNGTSATSG